MIAKEDNLYTWLEHHFYYDNHSKYRKYFNEWLNNLTKDQINGFIHQMIVEQSGILLKQKKTY